MKLIPAIAVAIAVAAAACKPSSPGRDSTVVHTPRVQDMSAARPDSPTAAHSQGIAILSCVERGDTLSVYRYQVRNGRAGMIVNWQLGYADDEPQDSASENNGGRLTVLPINSAPKFAEPDEWLPLGAYASPDHWRPEFVRVEETRGFLIAWVAEAPSNELGIAPGDRLGGFSVTVRGADSAYLTGPWTAYDLSAKTPMGRLMPAPCDSVR